MKLAIAASTTMRRFRFGCQRSQSEAVGPTVLCNLRSYSREGARCCRCPRPRQMLRADRRWGMTVCAGWVLLSVSQMAVTRGASPGGRACVGEAVPTGWFECRRPKNGMSVPQAGGCRRAGSRLMTSRRSLGWEGKTCSCPAMQMGGAGGLSCWHRNDRGAGKVTMRCDAVAGANQDGEKLADLRSSLTTRQGIERGKIIQDNEILFFAKRRTP